MQVSFILKEKNIKTGKTHYDGFDKSGSDEYELSFLFKTENCEIKILNVNCYVKMNNISVYSDYGIKETTQKFWERFKIFMDGVIHFTKSEVNFLEEPYFAGFATHGNEIISSSNLPEFTVPNGSYKLDNRFYEDIRKIINQLDSL